ncbi:MAG: glucose-6-phosphate isomerase [Candidatus Polarisedimenticolia bacterium]
MTEASGYGPDHLWIGALEFGLDFSGLRVPAGYAAGQGEAMLRAVEGMRRLEKGAIANPDERRMVGHYWLRDPRRAPSPALAAAIETTLMRVKTFGWKVRSGEIAPAPGERFEHLLVLGIGGSALGPQLAAEALGGPDDPLSVHFLDNTDPEGFRNVFETLGDEGLRRTLVVCVSKSGSTPETRNGLEETRARFAAAGLEAPPRLVAVTGEGSALDKRARAEGWIDVFPMWDWVGGRTSQTSAVGLLPMAILGHDVDGLLEGARLMDEATRGERPEVNPALRLALAWHFAGGGVGRRDMVVLPYRDRLRLLSRYLQQLVMESLGKETDLDGELVHQGLSVYGNKGSTDQHAFVQQLRDGLDNFFVTFVAALDDRDPHPLEVEPGTTSGDYLLGFLLGTRRALIEKKRLAAAICVPRVDARSLGGLIALFERAVGFYAAFANINAYHQPGVEAGKKAAARVLDLQRALGAAMDAAPTERRVAAAWAAAAGAPEMADEATWVLAHLAANRRGVVRETVDGFAADRYGRA